MFKQIHVIFARGGKTKTKININGYENISFKKARPRKAQYTCNWNSSLLQFVLKEFTDIQNFSH